MLLKTILFWLSAAQAASVLSEQVAISAASKAGLAWPNGNSVDIKQYLTTGKMSWYYTWSPTPVNTKLDFAPMLWGDKQIDQFSSTIDSTIKNHKVTAVLGFNEPNEGGQANMSPQHAAQVWKQHIEPLKARGIRLGSPAPSSAPSGKTWLQNWLKACNGGCKPDFIALHWYGTDADAFISYIKDMHSTFNLPVRVTEWACEDFGGGPQCSSTKVSQFLSKTQGFMDRTSWVGGYTWFGVMENLGSVNPANAMMTPQGKINALGRQYIGAK